MKNVFVACEFSGVVRDAFRRQGLNAWSCDLEEVEPEGEFVNYHLTGDCRDWLESGPDNVKWDLLIAHPPCTYLCNSGVRWLYKGGKGSEFDFTRWNKMQKACDFFLDLWGSTIPFRAIENPIMHKHAKRELGLDYTQIIQPWMFGHGETKATCLWLAGLPALQPTDIVSGREAKIHKMGKKKGIDRGRERSRFFPGIADAMVKQWGYLI